MIDRASLAIQGVIVEERSGDGTWHWFCQVLASNCEVDEALDAFCVIDDPIIVAEVGIIVRLWCAFVGLVVVVILDGAVDASAGLEVVKRVVAGKASVAVEERSGYIAYTCGKSACCDLLADVGKSVVVHFQEVVGSLDGVDVGDRNRVGALQCLQVVITVIGAGNAALRGEERSLLVAWLLGKRNFGAGNVNVGQGVVVKLDELEFLEGCSVGVELRKNAGKILEVVKRVFIAVHAGSSVVKRSSFIAWIRWKLSLLDLLLDAGQSEVASFLHILECFQGIDVAGRHAADAFIGLEFVELIIRARVASSAIECWLRFIAWTNRTLDLLDRSLQSIDSVVILLENVGQLSQDLDIGHYDSACATCILKVDEGFSRARSAVKSVEERLRGIALNDRLSLSNLRILLLDVGDCVIVHFDVLGECLDISDELPSNAGESLVYVKVVDGAGSALLLFQIEVRSGIGASNARLSKH